MERKKSSAGSNEKNERRERKEIIKYFIWTESSRKREREKIAGRDEKKKFREEKYFRADDSARTNERKENYAGKRIWKKRNSFKKQVKYLPDYSQ